MKLRLPKIWRGGASTKVARHADPSRDGVLRLPLGPAPTGPFAQDVVGVAVIGNETPYIREWVAFHYEVGLKSLLLYINRLDAADAVTAEIADFIASGYVRIMPWPGFLRVEAPNRPSFIQRYAYAHALAMLRGVARWAVILDADEFVFSPSHATLGEALAAYEDYPAVAAYWLNFGSGGLKEKPPGLVIESYTQAAAAPCVLNRQYKSIVQPHRIEGIFNAHRFLTDQEGVVAYDETRKPLGNWHYENNTHVSSIIRLNHYYVKSDAEFQERLGDGWGLKDPTMDKVRNTNRQKIEAETFEDRAILSHLDATRRRMASGPS